MSAVQLTLPLPVATAADTAREDVRLTVTAEELLAGDCIAGTAFQDCFPDDLVFRCQRTGKASVTIELRSFFGGDSSHDYYTSFRTMRRTTRVTIRRDDTRNLAYWRMILRAA